MSPAAPRMHVALNVSDLEASRRFYQDLFAVPADKLRPGYARFVLDQPPLVLTLNTAPDRVRQGNRLSHLGIRLGDAAALQAAHARLSAAGHALRVEQQVLCCHALQDKFWIVDPDGNEWEYYLLLDDLQDEAAAEQAAAAANRCCD